MVEKRQGAGAFVDDKTPTTRVGFSLIWKLVQPHLLSTVTAIFGAALFAGGTVASAMVLGWVTDDVIIAAFDPDLDPDGSQPVVAALAIVVVTVVRSVGVVTRRYYAGVTSERVERGVRDRLGDQYLKQPLWWLRSDESGRFLSHVDADARVLVEVLQPLPFACGVVCLVVFSGVRLFLIDPWVAVVALILFPVMMVVNSVYARFAERPLAAVQAEAATVAGIAHESFEGALIVKTLGRREAEVHRFDTAAAELQHHRVTTGFLRAAMDAAIHLLPPIGILSVIGLGAFRVRAGVMTAGDIVEVAALFAALAIPMLVVGFLLESLIPSVVAWNRLRPVIEAPEPVLPERAGGIAAGPLGVEVVGLSYAWPAAPDEKVLDSVSLTIEAGEVVALVGSTGSGKSTLVAAIAGVLDDAGDAVHVGGQVLAELHPADRASSIAYVFQEAFLFGDTVRANIDLDDKHDLEAIVRVAKLAAIDDWIAGQPDGYDTLIGERGVTVSGGQRQRIALARALLREAGLVVVDDATSAVDPVIEQQILEHLRISVDATLVLVANRPNHDCTC